MESNSHPLFDLNQISKWGQADSNIELPKVQRDFVWRPKQIEDLWDSMLRKYPVGSFVFNEDNKGKLQLLDGQQRATAITLGFANKTFRNTYKHIRIFIDLEMPKNEARKYYFRVITDSHPWGYQRKLNDKPLDAQQKREAVKYWNNVDLINPNLKSCFPFDATLPVPLEFFFQAKNTNELYQTILKWPLWKNVNNKLNDQIKENSSRITEDSEVFQLYNNVNFLKNRINQLYDDFHEMLKFQKIPALFLNDVWNSKNDTTLKENQKENSDVVQEHEVENLFVRLNAGGTPLRGEDLNYSILKSKIKPEIQKNIEKACEFYLSPARFITVAFRLYQYFDKENKRRESLSMNIKPRQFQSRLNKMEDIENFKNFLINLIESKKYDGKTLIEYSKYILEYHPIDNKAGFPHLVAKKMINNSPELLFMFWYRLVLKKDHTKFNINNDKGIHKRILGMYSIFLWFGKGFNNRDYSKLLKNIWPAMKVLDIDKFWSTATIKRAMIHQVLLPLPHFYKNKAKIPGISWFSKQTKQNNYTINTSLFDRLYKINNDYYFNIYNLFHEKDLVLYAQRDFHFKIFKQKQFHLDDTNVPFDWDHIYPNSLIKKKNTPRLIKEFYSTNGNFRAWPYELNRMDSDSVPAIKFNPLIENTDLKKSWKIFSDKHTDLNVDFNCMSANLLEWSVCKPDWLQSKVDDIKKGNAKEVFKLILERNIDLIENWYTALDIEKLIPIKSINNISIINNAFLADKCINNPKWLKTKLYKEIWNTSDDFNLIFNRKLKINQSYIYIYLTFSNDSDELINEDAISFGFYDKDKTNVFENMKLNDEGKYDLNKKDFYLQNFFTLVSEDEDSVKQLFSDIASWIKDTHFPLKKYRNEIFQLLADALKTKYKSCFV